MVKTAELFLNSALAVERGRDTTAALKCLDRLTQEQRQQVRTHRVDMAGFSGGVPPEVAP